jgi:hypothetical protein
MLLDEECKTDTSSIGVLHSTYLHSNSQTPTAVASEPDLSQSQVVIIFNYI